MKKILLVVTQSNWGGAQRYVFDLAKGLKNKGFSVTIASGGLENGALFERANSVGIKTLLLTRMVRSIHPVKDLAALLELFAIIKKEKFDVVHANSSKAGVIGSIAARLAGCPRVIFTAHGFVFNEKINFLFKLPYILAEMFTSLFRHKIIAVSEYDRQQALKYRIAPPGKISVVYNGVEEGKSEFLGKQAARDFLFSKVSGDRPGWGKKKIIGCIANFYKNKGLKYFLSAAAEVEREHTEAVFVIMGEGKLHPVLEKQIKRLRIGDKVFLLGFVDSAEKYLKGFDIYACPSLKEGLPYSLIEALYAGVPIVSTDVGGIPEIVANDESGILVKPGNVGALATAISDLLDNPCLTAVYAEGGRRAARKFKLSDMVEKTIKEYNI